nr:ABC transporter ATP-binding protein [Streptomyces sp. 846.5]
MGVGYLSGPLVSVVLAAFTDAAVAGRAAAAVSFAIAAGLLLIFDVMMTHFAHLSYYELGQLQQLELTEEVASIANGGVGIEQFDNHEFSETLTLVTEKLYQVRMALEATLQLGGVLVQAILTTVILAGVDPWLVLLPLLALPSVLVSNRAQRLVEAAREATAPDVQLSRHLVAISTTAASAKEIRLFGAQNVIVERQRAAWAAVTVRLWAAHRRSALLRSCGQLLFTAAYGSAILLVLSRAASGRASVGEVVLIITLAVQVSVQVASTLGLLGTLQTAGRLVGQMARLRELASPFLGAPGRELVRVPDVLHTGIRLERVSFAYPGTDRLILDDVSLDIPAGSTLALVGENGAGKSTLVKLICGLYQPTSGRILVDGVNLWDCDPEEWRSRIATLFQDFACFELKLRENVGTGRLEDVDDDERIRAALQSARATAVVTSVPGGFDGLLGHSYGDGAELSGGQWQSLGLARMHMRPGSLLLALDEPAAALDASAEHDLFERFVHSATSVGAVHGAITVFVSHRFSTVRSAHRIAVLDNGRIVESGAHDALMAVGGIYQELFSLQAGAYS